MSDVKTCSRCKIKTYALYTESVCATCHKSHEYSSELEERIVELEAIISEIEDEAITPDGSTTYEHDGLLIRYV